ncbi:DinB family protein [Bacillus spizizenii]|uniref:DinB family protein n=1 Tax=Bacillus spizizenii TaxID=96241 RepID=UPI0002FF9D48|nr:DinB family protein [Bacillus spizizenii]
MTGVKQLYDYHLWANKRIFNHIEGLPKETVYQEVKSVFPSVCDVLLHMCTTDLVWLRTLSGAAYEEVIESAGKFQAAAKGDMKAIKQQALELETLYLNLFSRLADERQTISFHPPKYGKLVTTYADVIQHVVNHGTYHRGNVTAMLRQLGHPGVPTDYVYYLYEKKESKG